MSPVLQWRRQANAVETPSVKKIDPTNTLQGVDLLLAAIIRGIKILICFYSSEIVLMPNEVIGTETDTNSPFTDNKIDHQFRVIFQFVLVSYHLLRLLLLFPFHSLCLVAQGSFPYKLRLNKRATGISDVFGQHRQRKMTASSAE